MRRAGGLSFRSVITRPITARRAAKIHCVPAHEVPGDLRIAVAQIEEEDLHSES